ncbi:MAG TPA: DUF4333 domain-containing protein [Thermoleophilaceae bacterium]|jgi:hypothetical protein
MKRATPLLLLVAVALAACGGKTLDTKNVEKDIQKLASQDGVETAVECPEEVSDADKGKTYECEITYAGNENNKQTVEMKIGDNDESEFVDQQAATDEGSIRQIVAESDANPASVCEHLSEDLLEQLGGDDCPTQAEEQDDGKPDNIKSIEVEGDTATMVTDQSTTTFERSEDGSWVATAIE